jgi:hypothetical protein
MRKHMLERGRMFASLQGVKHRWHKGVAYLQHKDDVVRVSSNGQVVLDPVGFRRYNPYSRFSKARLEYLDDSDDEDDKGRENSGEAFQSSALTEEKLLITSPLVVGFSLSEKCWMEFSLSGIEDVNWSNDAFDSLVLPYCIKKNLTDLISRHLLDQTQNVERASVEKGKGLNVVLHGPPGVGKTLTCEAMAEHLKCPLYVINPGEIGDSAESVEQHLGEVFEMTRTWGAIVLLDNADAFLEARQPHDIHRNSIVSVLLQCLEHHQVVLFIILSQVDTIDVGLQCRLQIGIRYERLPATARRKIWQYHLERFASNAEKSMEKSNSFTGVEYDELSKRELNGRQVCLPTADWIGLLHHSDVESLLVEPGLIES